MHGAIRAAVALATFSVLISPALVQQRVDLRNMYERCTAVVPLGKGTFEDPKRPMYAPLRSAIKSGVRTGILGFTHVLSDDGKLALTQLVARDRSALHKAMGALSVRIPRRAASRGAI